MAFGLMGGIGVKALMMAHMGIVMVMITKTEAFLAVRYLIRARYISALFAQAILRPNCTPMFEFEFLAFYSRNRFLL
jgi:hypothetical protein